MTAKAPKKAACFLRGASVIDSEAAGGIIVSPLGLQEGAAKIAAGRIIISVKLNAKSTPPEFAFQFLNKLCLGISAKATTSGRVSPRYLRECAKCSKKFESLGSPTARTVIRILVKANRDLQYE